MINLSIKDQDDYILDLVKQYDNSGSKFNIVESDADIYIINDDLDEHKILPENKYIIIGNNLSSRSNIDNAKYLSEPIKISILFEILERYIESISREVYINKDYNLNIIEKYLIDHKKNKLLVTEKEMEIILYLAKNRKIIPKDELLTNIWNHQNKKYTHTIETHIYRLRQKLGENNFIINDKKGYFIE